MFKRCAGVRLCAVLLYFSQHQTTIAWANAFLANEIDDDDDERCVCFSIYISISICVSRSLFYIFVYIKHCACEICCVCTERVERKKAWATEIHSCILLKERKIRLNRGVFGRQNIEIITITNDIADVQCVCLCTLEHLNNHTILGVRQLFCSAFSLANDY